MRDPEDQTTASSSKQEDSQGSIMSRFRRKPNAAAAPHAVIEEHINLSRNWGGAGIPLTITLGVREARRLLDCRILWGLPNGFDGYSLLQFERTDGSDGTTVSFTVPAQALPGVYAIQLQNGSHFLRKFQFVVTAQEPPETSPFRILHTDPAGGALRMYLTFDRRRSNPEQAVEAVATLMKRYDTFLRPAPDDPDFQEILKESLTQEQKRQQFATWLVSNQLEAEKEA